MPLPLAPPGSDVIPPPFPLSSSAPAPVFRTPREGRSPTGNWHLYARRPYVGGSRTSVLEHLLSCSSYARRASAHIHSTKRALVKIQRARVRAWSRAPGSSTGSLVVVAGSGTCPLTVITRADVLDSAAHIARSVVCSAAGPGGFVFASSSIPMLTIAPLALETAASPTTRRGKSIQSWDARVRLTCLLQRRLWLLGHARADVLGAALYGESVG